MLFIDVTSLANVFKDYGSRRQKPVQSPRNNGRTTFTERCSNVILQTLNRFLPADTYLTYSLLWSVIKRPTSDLQERETGVDIFKA